MSETSNISFKPPPPINPTRFALITPSASPPASPFFPRTPRNSTSKAPPAKRQRLSSTPSSSRATPTLNYTYLSDPQNLDEARKAANARVLSVWSQLAERYSRPLEDDDIIDLRTGGIVKDRGVLRGMSRRVGLGSFLYDDTHEQEDSSEGGVDVEEDGEDVDEIDAFNGVDGEDGLTLASKNVVIPPVTETDPTDAADLKEFMERERMRKQLLGGDEDEDPDVPPEVLAAVAAAFSDREEGSTSHAEELQEEESDAFDSEASEEDDLQVQEECALATDEEESEDEFAAWDIDEPSPMLITPKAKSRSPQLSEDSLRENLSDDSLPISLTSRVKPGLKPTEEDIIDLTSPSPPSSPIRRGRSVSRPRALSKPPPLRSKSKFSPRAKSKTPARRISAVSPQRQPSPVLQLHTPPQSQSSVMEDASYVLPPSNMPRSAPSTPPPQPGKRPRPRPVPRYKRAASASSQPITHKETGFPPIAVYPSAPNTDLVGLTSYLRSKPKPMSIGPSKPKMVVEVVIPPRARSAKPSGLSSPELEIDRGRVSKHDVMSTAPSATNLRKGKGKAKDHIDQKTRNSSPAFVGRSSPLSSPLTSPSPPRIRKSKLKLANKEQSVAPLTPARKRKRVLSSSSMSGGSAKGESPTRTVEHRQNETQSGKKPLSRKAPGRKSNMKSSSPQQSDTDSGREVNYATSQPRDKNTPAPHPLPVYPYPLPYTPTDRPHSKDRRQSSQYPPPPMLPVQDPQAQYYFAQAVQHLSYLMSGSAGPGFAPSPYPPQFNQQHLPWLPYTPKRPRDAGYVDSSSPQAGPSQSSSRFTTPRHQPHPYPYTFDPAYSLASLPPSSPPPSSPSSPLQPSSPVQPPKSAIRVRSKSRGRRVSFKLDDEDRPRFAQQDEEESASTNHAMRNSSPDPPLGSSGHATRSRSRARQIAPDRSQRGNVKTRTQSNTRTVVTEEESEEAPLATGVSGRGRTPGPPAVRKR